MITRVQQWGNSLGVRLPKFAAQQVHIVKGTAVNILVHNDGIIVRPAPKKGLKLKDLLAAIKPENLHSEINSGHRVGKEILWALLPIEAIWCGLILLPKWGVR